tara:strand:- start:9548 stop:9733 length:186 start_codon:yes stop_codon:yes gene_type:complete
MIEGTVKILNESLQKAEGKIMSQEQVIQDLLKSFHMLQQVMVVHTEKIKKLEEDVGSKSVS